MKGLEDFFKNKKIMEPEEIFSQLSPIFTCVDQDPNKQSC